MRGFTMMITDVERNGVTNLTHVDFVLNGVFMFASLSKNDVLIGGVQPLADEYGPEFILLVKYCLTKMSLADNFKMGENLAVTVDTNGDAETITFKFV